MFALKEFTRRLLPETFDPGDPKAVSAEFDRIASRPRKTVAELEDFIAHWMELASAIHDKESRAYVRMTCDTADKEAESSYLYMVETIDPITQTRTFELKKLLLESPAAANLPKHYVVFLRNVKNEIDLFREENVPLSTEESKLAQRHQKITGSWMCEWEGKQLTVQQVRAKFEETDRGLRERAFRSVYAPHLADCASLDALYDEMMAVRVRMARNAGFANFRDYAFRRWGRFDYTPADCQTFHAAIRQHVVPLVTKLAERRRARLGLDSLRPWDLEVDEEGRPPVRAFADGAELTKKVGAVFDGLDPELAFFFGSMRDRGMLDLESRKGKAPGGYMTEFAESRIPFIFMNAVGTRRDVETLLHESGHAFNLFLAREIEPAAYLSPPLEFAEVASMSMELLSRPLFELIYAPNDIPRVKEQQLAAHLKFFPFMSMIDSFQHWVYTHETTPESRGDFWAGLEDEFRPHLDWAGLEDFKRLGWQYLHVFQLPFYYIEYGIALTGALQVWQAALKNPQTAIAAYKRGLALGGSRPLPELFSTVGARFDFSGKVLAELTETLAKELAL